VSLKVSANVVSAEDNWVVSRALMWWSGCPQSGRQIYGDVVRSIGMGH